MTVLVESPTTFCGTAKARYLVLFNREVIIYGCMMREYRAAVGDGLSQIDAP